MIELNFGEREILSPICKNSKEVLILSAVENKMGRVWADSVENPRFFFVKVGDYLYTCGDVPNEIEIDEVNNLLYENCIGNVIMPENQEWEDWFEHNLTGDFDILPRYYLSKEEDNFSVEALENFVNSMNEKFSLKKIGEFEYDVLINESWSFDFVGHFKDKNDFLQNGMGYCVYYNDEIISGSSTYGYCDGKIDIAVATREDYRKNGLALVTSAKLMLECFNNDIYPNWDAANLGSLSIAKKLGYIYGGEFKTFILK